MNELYPLYILLRNTVSTLQKFFDFFFPNVFSMWKDVYILCGVVTIITRLHVFQYKVLYNTLYLSKHFCIFKLIDAKLCSFCHRENETIINLFVDCLKSKTLWNSLKEFLKDTIDLPLLDHRLQSLDSYKMTKNYFLFKNIFHWYLNTSYMFQDVPKPFHLQPLKSM